MLIFARLVGRRPESWPMSELLSSKCESGNARTQKSFLILPGEIKYAILYVISTIYNCNQKVVLVTCFFEVSLRNGQGNS